MRPCNPRHRYEALFLKKRVPENDLERSLYVLQHGPEELNRVTPYRKWEEGQIVDPSVEYPYHVHKLDPTRAVLEAFLISSEDDNAIATALAMPTDQVYAYRHLFFDTTVFKTDLELIVFMQEIPEDNKYKGLYKVAFHQGLGALQWHFCRKKSVPAPVEVVKTIMTDSFYRSLENRGLSINSKTAKEAMKLARVSLECARSLMSETMTSTEDSNSLQFKFEEAKRNRTIEDITAEVLH